MSPRLRRFFFWAFAAVFVAVGAYLVLTTQGIVVDFSHLRLVKTGAIILRPAPLGEVGVTLNGKAFIKDNSFFGKTISFDRLIPGSYEVTVKKEGYAPWKKGLVVKPGMATRNEDLILFPGDAARISFSEEYTRFLAHETRHCHQEQERNAHAREYNAPRDERGFVEP